MATAPQKHAARMTVFIRFPQVSSMLELVPSLPSHCTGIPRMVRRLIPTGSDARIVLFVLRLFPDAGRARGDGGARFVADLLPPARNRLRRHSPGGANARPVLALCDPRDGRVAHRGGGHILDWTRAGRTRAFQARETIQAFAHPATRWRQRCRHDCLAGNYSTAV